MKLWRGQSWKRRLAVLAGGSALTVIAGCTLGYVTTDVPPPNAISTDQALQLLYSDGSVMARFGKNRVLVRLDQVAKPAQQAVLAAEDRGFYSEPGISFKGIARALFTNVKGGGVSQGGSTITQQYAKNAFLTQRRTFTRKVKEVFIAVKMSRTVSKAQILEDYLNTIYFGRGAFGIEAASQTYFGVRAAKLTVAQAAVLASSIRSPAGYDPIRHPERAKARWAYVLDGMVKEHWLDAAVRAAAVYPRVLPVRVSGSLPGDLDHVRDQVIAELQRHGFPEDRLAIGGLTVVTTIQRKAQDAARISVQALIPAGKGDAPVAALVAVQPGTGQVVAYYGGRQPGGFDWADQGKGVQPGSSMKPYVLATALANGKHLTDLYDGKSPQQVCGDTVSNDGGDPPFGQVDLATALAHSVNVVYTRLACEVGPKKVRDLAHAAGITTPLDGEGNLSQQIALGSGGYQVHPLDQADGYATFAAGGTHAAPYFVRKVKDGHGNVLYTATESTDRPISEDVAANTIAAMEQVVLRGTGTRARLAGRPTAGKTGTTSKNTNAWFCGFTPQLSTAVWVGRPSGAPLQGVLGISGGVYGGRVPAQIFHDFMTAALQGEPVKQFPKPSIPVPTATPAPSATATPSPTPSPSLTAVLPSAVPTATPPPSPTAIVTPTGSPLPLPSPS